MIFTDSLFGGSARWVAAKTAGHATEIPYVWKMMTSPVGDIGPGDKPVADLMHACWSTFAKNGRACAQWPAYTKASDQLMEFGLESAVRVGFKKAAFNAQQAIALPGLKLGE